MSDKKAEFRSIQEQRAAKLAAKKKKKVKTDSVKASDLHARIKKEVGKTSRTGKQIR